MMELINDDFLQIFSKDNQKVYNVLVNLSPVGKISSYGLSAKTRKIGYQLASNRQVGKSALVTPSLFLKAAIGFMITAAGKREIIKCFTDGKEAIEWLK